MYMCPAVAKEEELVNTNETVIGSSCKENNYIKNTKFVLFYDGHQE